MMDEPAPGAPDKTAEKRPKVVRILIADDHRIFREGLRKLLEAEGFVVVGEAADGEQAVQLAGELKPDVMLLDLAMPRMPGLDALRELAGSPAGTGIKTILLTAAIEREEIGKALQLGARGVVMKDSATQLLFKSIRCVIEGQYWVGRESVSDLVETLRALAPQPGEEPQRKNFGLTPRELQILATIVAGYTNKDIAQKFSLSEQTVKHHLSNIFNKTGVSNRLELALFGINHRLVDNLK